MRNRNIAFVIWLVLSSNLMSCKPTVEANDEPKETPTTASKPSSPVVPPVSQPTSNSMGAELNAWQRATPEMRDAMAEKIVSSGSLMGKVEDEVEAQLGKPDFRSERLIYSFEFGEKFEGLATPSFILNMDCEGMVETAGQTSYPRNITPDSFDEQKWKKGTEQERFYMAPALAKSKRLVGMSRESALSLLGEPTKRTLPQIVYYSRTRSNGSPASAGPNRKLIFKFNESLLVEKVIYTQK